MAPASGVDPGPVPKILGDVVHVDDTILHISPSLRGRWYCHERIVVHLEGRKHMTLLVTPFFVAPPWGCHRTVWTKSRWRVANICLQIRRLYAENVWWQQFFVRYTTWTEFQAANFAKAWIAPSDVILPKRWTPKKTLQHKDVDWKTVARVGPVLMSQ